MGESRSFRWINRL